MNKFQDHNTALTSMISQFKLDIPYKSRRCKGAKRAKSGCFCCRKRKIKCDETRPYCHNCQKSSYVCIWPTESESLPHKNNFRLVKQSHHLSLVRKEGIQNGRVTSHSKKQAVEDALYCWILKKTYEEISQSLYYIPPTLMVQTCSTETDSFIYDAFIKGYMIDVTPQFAHKNLQPGSVIIPRGIENQYVIQIFYACGSAFLCWDKPDMIDLANTKHEELISSLNHLLVTHQITGSEEWLFVMATCMLLRDKYYGMNFENNIGELLTITSMVRYWLSRKIGEIGYGKFSPENVRAIKQFINSTTSSQGIEDLYDVGHTGYQNYEGITDDLNQQTLRKRCSSVFLRLKNSIEDLQHDLNLITSSDVHVDNRSVSTETEGTMCGIVQLLTDYHTTNWERTTIESFLYNYTINMFICDRTASKYLVSPYILYPALRAFLVPQIYECAASWMNNPVMGASLLGFEIVARANWLGLRYPFSKSDKIQASLLRKSAQYYVHPILPSSVKSKEPKNVQRRLMESCFIGDMVAKCAFIYLSKLLDPDLRATDERIVSKLQSSIEDLKNISIHSKTCSTCVWPLMIMGMASVNESDRQYLIKRINEFNGVLRTAVLKTILGYFRKGWNEMPKNYCWNSLVSREYTKYIFL